MNDINRLTCEEVFRRLDDYLDRELTPEELQRVREHLTTCELCAKEYQFEERILTGLRERLRRISAPSDLAQKVAKALARAKEEGSAG
jgi:anti-sigma factor (TIGR02949 family)